MEYLFKTSKAFQQQLSRRWKGRHASIRLRINKLILSGLPIALISIPRPLLANPLPTPAQPSPLLSTRMILNGGFEQPNQGKTEAGGVVPEGYGTTPPVIWQTTEDTAPYTNALEIWNGVNTGAGGPLVGARSGSQYAELNGSSNASLYQDICIRPNENIQWSLWHAARNSGQTNIMQVSITDPSLWITNTGKTPPSTKFYNSGNLTTSYSQGWLNKTGSWSSTNTQIQPLRFAFAAIQGSNGNQSYGNFLDDVSLQLSPIIDFAPTDTTNNVNLATTIEGNGGNYYYLTVRINGVMQAAGSVNISLSGLNAKRNFTLGTVLQGKAQLAGLTATKSGNNITLNIPAGSYDPNQPNQYINIPIDFGDTLTEPNDSLTFTLSNPTGGGSSALAIPDLSVAATSCLGPARATVNTALIDDDASITGKVINDANKNGVFDTGETGFSTPVTVILKDSSNNNTVATTTTAADGTYTFNNVTVGTGYKVVVTPPSGTTETLDPDGNKDNQTAGVNATAGNTTIVNPFAYSALLISGTVFSDADADVTINGSDAGTNAGSATLTIYAVDAAGKVVDKATVAPNGIYTLTNIPTNSSVKLRLSNDSSVAVGGIAPTSPSLPTGWFHTGKNLNGTIDGTIATLGDIALTTTTTNVTNQNFGIRQSYVIAPDPAPNTCNPDYTGALTTGISASGGQLPVGSNDSNWTVEWIQGPSPATSGVDTPYALPRPVGVMPAVVVGNLAVEAGLNEPPNARWISYPFRLSNNGNGYHPDANLNGISSELSSATSGTTDAVRLKFTSTVTLPSNANTIAISLPIGVAVDNQFVSIKVNGVENLVPLPTPNAQALGFVSTASINLTKGWQAGVNTIEIVVDSGPDYVGFFLKVNATTTQVCSSNPNVLLVKRITALNGGTTTVGGDNLANYIDDPNNPYDDNNLHNPTPNPPSSQYWPNPNTFLIGGISGGKVIPGDELEYTIYFLSAGQGLAKNVLLCDRVPDNTTFVPTAFNSVSQDPSGISGSDRGILLSLGGSSLSLTNAGDGDRGQFFPAGVDPKTVYSNINCGGSNTNGAVVVNLGDLPNATASGQPTNSYGFFRFRGKVK